MKHQLKQLLVSQKLGNLLEQYSPLDESGLLKGIWKRCLLKIFPRLLDDGDIIKNLKSEKWATVLNDTINLNQTIDFSVEEATLVNLQIVDSIQALSTKLLAYGLDYKFKSKLEKVGLDHNVYKRFYNELQSIDPHNKTKLKALVKHLDHILESIQEFRNRKAKIGTTISLTYRTARIDNKVNQLKQLIRLLLSSHLTSTWLNFISQYHAKQRKEDSILAYVKEHIELLALVTVDNTAIAGVQYIADNAAAVKQLFIKSLVGGFVIAIFAIFKIKLSGLGLSLGLEAFWSSINYAACFIVVKKLGGSIATKQPALTSSRIAQGIDPDNDLLIQSDADIISIIKKSNVSQFVAFAGNLLMAFPLALLIATLSWYFLGYSIADGYKSNSLVSSTNINHSNIVLFSAIAGVFLALSGLISGFIDNKVVVIRLRERLHNNRLFNTLWSGTTINRIANYCYSNSGHIIGNISLGFLLGGIEYITQSLVVNLEIRHIAFSAANFGYAILHTSESIMTLLVSGLSIFAIGFINFIVSFSLTFYIALLSRKVSLSYAMRIIRLTCLAFYNDPKSFFIFEK